MAFSSLYESLSLPFLFFLERVTARITEKLIVVSKADLETGFKNRVSVPDKFSLIHYGIEREKFDKVYKVYNVYKVYKERRKFPPYTVITVSSLKPQKGISHFLQIAKETENIYKEIEC